MDKTSNFDKTIPHSHQASYDAITNENVLSLSSSVFSIDWHKFYPKSFTNRANKTFVVDPITASDVNRFLEQHGKEIYTDAASGSLPAANIEEQRRAYYEHAVDCFGFFVEGELAGFFLGSAQDWKSYYLRNATISPKFQGMGIYSLFLTDFLTDLKKSGIQYTEGDVSPTNRHHIHVLNQMGFHIMGTTVSPQWGLLLKFVKYLDPNVEAACLARHCMTRRDIILPATGGSV